jgi:hypothetical protein
MVVPHFQNNLALKSGQSFENAEGREGIGAGAVSLAYHRDGQIGTGHGQRLPGVGLVVRRPGPVIEGVLLHETLPRAAEDMQAVAVSTYGVGNAG